ncbi:hypothetical protein AB0442_40580, partial [Kitasatospora sp. NPDC085895]|uniref:hypothetical protein n=1 Tax=Kitasatospora sp. NPDC085895 TaxID=3155057 RepID=UPI00344D609E
MKRDERQRHQPSSGGGIPDKRLINGIFGRAANQLKPAYQRREHPLSGHFDGDHPVSHFRPCHDLYQSASKVKYAPT